MILWLLALGAGALLGGYAIQRVLREQLALQPLSFPTVIVVWALYVWLTALAFLAAWLGIAPLDIPVWLRGLAGGSLLAVGVLLAAAGIGRMASLSRMSGRELETLVTGGVYRSSRNPQNVGWGLAMLGAAIAGDSAFALAGTSVALALFVAYIPSEERFLGHVHGAAYERYLRSVPRYLGLPSASE